MAINMADSIPATISYAKVVRKDDGVEAKPSIVHQVPEVEKTVAAESAVNDPNYEDMEEDESFRFVIIPKSYIFINVYCFNMCYWYKGALKIIVKTLECP